MQINYQSNQTNCCSKAMRQRKYFRTKKKYNLQYRQLREMSNAMKL